MFGLDVPDWFFPVAITGLCVGLIYLILHCIVEHAKIDNKRQIKKGKKLKNLLKKKALDCKYPCK